MTENDTIEKRLLEESGCRRWRRYRTSLRLLRKPIEWAPFLNLGLLALMAQFFSSVFVLQPGIKVELPVSSYATGTQYGRMIVSITQEGMIFFNDERVTLDTLGHAFIEARRRNNATALTVQADYRVPYGLIARIMSIALEAEIPSVNLASDPAFDRDTPPWLRDDSH